MDIISYALSKKGIPPLDTSLTIANAAADSKATGDKLSELKEDLNALGLSVVDGLLNITYEEVTV